MGAFRISWIVVGLAVGALSMVSVSSSYAAPVASCNGGDAFASHVPPASNLSGAVKLAPASEALFLLDQPGYSALDHALRSAPAAGVVSASLPWPAQDDCSVNLFAYADPPKDNGLIEDPAAEFVGIFSIAKASVSVNNLPVRVFPPGAAYLVFVGTSTGTTRVMSTAIGPNVATPQVATKAPAPRTGAADTRQLRIEALATSTAARETGMRLHLSPINLSVGAAALGLYVIGWVYMVQIRRRRRSAP